MKMGQKEKSIRYSMIRSIILCVLLPLSASLAVLCGILQYHVSSGITEAFQMMFDQNVREIDEAILQSNYASSITVTYTENNRLLKNYYAARNAYEKNKATEGLEKLIQNSEITLLGGCQGEMLLVMNDGRLINSSGMKDLDRDLEVFAWFPRIGSGGQRPYWDNGINQLFDNSGEKRYVAFGRALKRYQEQPQGYAFVRIPEAVFSRFSEDPRFQKGTVAMFDEGGRILTGGNQSVSEEALEAVYEHWNRSGEARGRFRDLYYMVSRLSYSSNVVVYGVKKHDMFMRGERIVLSAVAFMLLSAAALVWIIRSIAKYITDPILFFAAHAPLIEQNRPELITLEQTRFREIRELQEGMLKAQDRIMSLIEEVRREAAMKERARFEALKAQINPHFLFNTLNAVRWKASGNQDQEVADILDQLGVLLGETYRNTREFETIGNAMRTLEAYVEIMKVRFGDKTQFFFVIPEELRSYLIPRFCLQPIVENSFIHGMSHVESGVIALRAEQADGDIILTLIDNGPGTGGREIDMTGAGKAKGRGLTGIGLPNIHNRIQTLFGREYGLKVDTTVEVGFKISLVIPAILAEEEENVDESTDRRR